MATKRTPINRSPITQVTARSVQLFDAMRRCRCISPGNCNAIVRCSACDRWWKLQNALCDELATPIYQYPCVEDPRDGGNRPDAEALWRALDAASREARRQERAARKAATQPQPDQPPPG